MIENTPKHKNIFIKIFFILNVFVYTFFIFSTLVYPVMFENKLRVYIGCCYDPDQTEIEPSYAGGPENKFSFYSLNSSQKQSAGFTPANVDFSAAHKTSLISYNNYVRHQLKLFNHTFTPRQQPISMLQKSNIWHQSSDEDPAPFS